MTHPKRFQKVNIEISNICNLQCSFCPEVRRAQQMMDLDLFTRSIEQVAPLTEMVCFHLMGEPLAHPLFEKFVQICHLHSVPIFLVSNGVLLREKQSELLLHPAFRQVNFSLHSFFDNFPKKDPEAYLSKIFAFIEAALLRRPDLYINLRLWNLSSGAAAKARRAQGAPNAPKEHSNDLLLKQISDQFGVPMPTDIDPRTQKGFRLLNRLYLHFDSEFTWPDLSLPILGSCGRCLGLKSHFGILVDGTVVPCCLDKEAAIPLGNLQYQELSAILQGDRAQKMLKGFSEGKLLEDLCQRCQYIERFQSTNKNDQAITV